MFDKSTEIPSADRWLREAKGQPGADRNGMYLIHNGVVRSTSRAVVRDGAENTGPVREMLFSYDEEKALAAIAEAERMPGIGCVRVWLNSGRLQPGEDIMLVLIGSDIRPHAVDALQYLVGELKKNCITEQEIL